MKHDKTINFSDWKIPKELKELLNNCVESCVPENRNELLAKAIGGTENMIYDVAYDVPGKGMVVEATVVRCKNGLSINYPDEYMRRRDPDCMVIADDKPTDKEHYKDRYNKSFDPLRSRTFEWLKSQKLIVMPFTPGQELTGCQGLLVSPDNAGFFAGGLGDLQGMIPASEIPSDFEPKTIIYLAPPFRHTDFDGEQVVVHNRENDMHEIFSYNLYPGPSAKKGVYGALINMGEKANWLTLHGSAVQVTTPYDNIVNIMHEGASGSGKSELLEHVHRTEDGRLLLGKNSVSEETLLLTLNQSCQLNAVCDDMALCPPNEQNDQGKLIIADAEDAWFLRINHLTKYGTEPHLEKLCIEPKEPLIYLNLDGVPNATCLPWEPIEDSPGKPCPNPRVIMPRRLIPGIINEPTEIHIRSFGIRTPVCTEENPTYGILGFLHILPPALAWIWRLVAPRGHDNPSIVDSEGLSSEGVGSYWPFATGRKVDQANLLLRQIQNNYATKYVLSPNQNVGAWEVSFMPQWLAREYLARRGGANFRPEQVTPARCSLLGYAMKSMQIEGVFVPEWLLEVDKQSEVRESGYDKGAKLLYDFFCTELSTYLEEDLDPLGKEIIQCCLNNGTVEDYAKLL